jgi:hypothetical protein
LHSVFAIRPCPGSLDLVVVAIELTVGEVGSESQMSRR